MTPLEIANLKLECLRIAKEALASTGGDILAKAKELYEFVNPPKS